MARLKDAVDLIWEALKCARDKQRAPIVDLFPVGTNREPGIQVEYSTEEGRVRSQIDRHGITRLEETYIPSERARPPRRRQEWSPAPDLELLNLVKQGMAQMIEDQDPRVLDVGHVPRRGVPRLIFEIMTPVSQEVWRLSPEALEPLLIKGELRRGRKDWFPGSPR